jgi:hypothetical protein
MDYAIGKKLESITPDFNYFSYLRWLYKITDQEVPAYWYEIEDYGDYGDYGDFENYVENFAQNHSVNGQIEARN